MSEEKSVAERLKEAQAKVKALSMSRDKIISDAGAEKQKLEAAYANLVELGVEEPEKLSIKELQALSEKFEGELTEKLSGLEAELTKGEGLIQKYQELQET